MSSRPVTRARAAPLPASQPAPSPLVQGRCSCSGSAGLTGECDECRRDRLTERQPLVQPSLRIGPANDRYERQADRVAEQVMRMPEPGADQRTARQALAQQITPLLQRQPAGRSSPARGPDMAPRLRALRGAGQPLNPATRSFFEPRLGYDFGSVRVHSGGHAAGLARSLRARAFTFGRHIGFAAGEYAPRSAPGRTLLAHELVHVVQQQRGRSGSAVQRQRARPPRSVSFTAARPPRRPDHSQRNPGPPGPGANRAGYTRARLRRRLSVTWSRLATRSVGGRQTVPIFLSAADVFFWLNPIEVFVSSNYAVGSCPYRVTWAHENEHVRAFVRIFNQHRATMIRRANAVYLPTRSSPHSVPVANVAAAESRYDRRLAAAINHVRALAVARMRADRATRDSPAAYRRVHARCPRNQW